LPGGAPPRRPGRGGGRRWSRSFFWGLGRRVRPPSIWDVVRDLRTTIWSGCFAFCPFYSSQFSRSWSLYFSYHLLLHLRSLNLTPSYSKVQKWRNLECLDALFCNKMKTHCNLSFLINSMF
jgi:hypothetical protein